MTITEAPLERQVISLDLSKGVDERTRPELIQGAANVTRLENLVQDQTGAWVKRQGLTVGPYSDGTGTGTYPVSMRKVMQLVKGWGVIADGGKLLHKQDTQTTFRTRQPVMDFNVTSAQFCGSSGPQAQDATLGAAVLAVASNSTHDCFIIRGLTTYPYGYSERLIITERSTGAEYSYNIATITASSGQYRAMCFVGGRYLNVFVSSSSARWFMIDTQAAMPVNEAAITTTLISGLAYAIGDAVGGATVSYLVAYDPGGLNNYLFRVNGTTGAVLTTSAAFAGSACSSISVNETASFLAVAASGVSAYNCNTLNLATAAFGPVSSYVAARNDASLSTIVVRITTAAVGGTTVDVIKSYNVTYGGAGTIVGACYGWTPVSKPFFCAQSNRYYMHVVKQDTTNDLATHAILDLSTFVGLSSNTAGLALPFGAFRVACQLEPYAGLRRTAVTASYGSGSASAFHYDCYDGYEFSACVPYQTAARTCGVAFSRCRLYDATAFGTANFSGSTYIAHGGLNQYDGGNLVEQGFADMPIVDKVVSLVNGNLAGSYRYVAVYRHVDSNGASSYSRTYGPVAATNALVGSGKNTITITPPGLTARDTGKGDSAPIVDLYRTKTAGTQYYLCATSQQNISGSVQQLAPDATTGLLTVLDNLSDTDLGSQAIMYRQPGTTNAPADRYAAPATKLVIQHKDRLFCVDPYGQRVYYSSFFVDGECAWFNPTFNFFVHAGTGPITALASMDGRLFIFKQNAIFVVDGDGPGEAGPTGNEYSPPQMLASRFGCVDHRSVVVGPDGIMYRSTRGFELINRSLQIKWVGERVWQTAETYPITTGSCIDSAGRAHFLCALSEGANGSYNIAGTELVYDFSSDAWSTHRYTDSSATYGGCKQSVAEVTDSGTQKLVYCDNRQTAGVATAAAWVDVASGASSFVPLIVESGWIKNGPQMRQRVSEVMLLARKKSNHALKISLAYDYSPTYTQSFTWQPNVINGLSIEQLSIQPTTQLVLAIRVKIEDIAPTDLFTYPIGTGEGCEVLSIAADVATKRGLPNLAGPAKGAAIETVGDAILTETSDRLLTETGDLFVMES